MAYCRLMGVDYEVVKHDQLSAIDGLRCQYQWCTELRMCRLEQELRKMFRVRLRRRTVYNVNRARVECALERRGKFGGIKRTKDCIERKIAKMINKVAAHEGSKWVESNTEVRGLWKQVQQGVLMVEAVARALKEDWLERTVRRTRRFEEATRKESFLEARRTLSVSMVQMYTKKRIKLLCEIII